MEILLGIFLSEGITLPSGEDFVNKVFPNIWAFLVQLIAFLIMIALAIKLAYKPVHNLIEKRKELVANNLKNAEEKSLQAEKNLAETKANLSKSNKEAINIIQEARKEAEKQKEAVLEETNKEIAEKHAKAQENIKREQEKAIKELHDEVVDLAYEASKNILGRSVKTDDDKKLVDNFVEDLMEKR